MPEDSSNTLINCYNSLAQYTLKNRH